MSFDFHFRGLQEKKELTDLINFLSAQDLGYPRYDEWIQKTERELDSGYKKAILAFSDNKLVGDLVFQQHKEISCFVELKNLRIHPDLRIRDFGRFMLRQAEVESREKYDAIICDTHANQTNIVNFLENMGYSPLAIFPLYDQNTPELVMVKFLNPNKKEYLLPRALKSLTEK